MPLVTIHFHTKEGERINLGKDSKQLARDFEKSKVDYLILTDKVRAGETPDAPIKTFEKIKSYLRTKGEGLLFGLEFLTYDNSHLLGLCLDQEKWKNKRAPKKLEEICTAIEKTNGIIAVPHQFGPCGLKERVSVIEKMYESGEIGHRPLIEISYYLETLSFLDRRLSKINQKSLNYARKNNYPIFSGLDSRFRDFTQAYNFCDVEPEIALKKASQSGFKNNCLIPYISLSRVPMVRETLYLVRDWCVDFLRK
ncbi:MAG: hypothetical protein QXX38_00650 [Candidatus Aenigmatarchaeota archaeon]